MSFTLLLMAVRFLLVEVNFVVRSWIMFVVLSLWLEKSLWFSSRDLSICSILFSLRVLSFEILIASFALFWALVDDLKA